MLLFDLSRKKELRTRNAILRGLYEENLRIIGKKRTRIATRSRIFSRRLLFLSLIAAMVLVHYENNLTPSFIQQRTVTANIISDGPVAAPEVLSDNPSRSPSVAGSDKPSDYRAFLDDKAVSLSSLLGLGVKTIMIDPGHGGSDTGTVGTMGTAEKDLTLDIAKRLKRLLESHTRYTVFLTRDHDTTLPLNRRVQLANVSRADLFISIHLNYLPQKPINIIETYYFGPTTDPATLHLAQKENEGSQYGHSDFKEIIAKIGTTFKSRESRQFALSIQKNLFQNVRRENSSVFDYGVKRAPFVVLLGVDIPAVLAEVSCLSNREEELKLTTEVYRENLARYLEVGILDYLTRKGEGSHEAKGYAARR